MSFKPDSSSIKVDGTTCLLMHLKLMEMLSFTHVTIKSPRTGRVIVVRNVRDALTMLTQYWSRRRGEKHRIACDACRNALDEKLSAEDARAAFVAASLEAGIDVSERTGSQLGTTLGASTDQPGKPANTI